MSRIGRIGDDNSYTSSNESGGRVGRIGLSTQDLDKEYQSTTVKKKKQDDLKKKLAEIDARTEQAKKDVWSPQKILQDNLNAAANVGKALVVDPAVTLYKQAETAVKGGQTSFDKGAGLVNKDLAKNQEDYIRSEQKKGTISKERADQEVSKLKTNSDKATKKLEKAEQETGVKYSPGEGAFAALDTVGLATGLGEIGQIVLRKAVEKQAQKVGRELTENEVKDLAVKTKSTVKEAPTATQTENVLESTDAPVITRTQPVEVSPVSEVPKTTVEPIKQKSFAPLDQATQQKVVKLVDDSTRTPVPEGKVRLYQTQDASEAGKLSDQYFKDTDNLANFINGRADNAKLTFKDVPESQVAQVPGKPQVFKIREEGETVSTPPAGDTVSGNARRIEAKAVEKKLTDKFEDLPEYKAINMKEQADEAINLVNNDRKLAEEIIAGKANAPGNLRAQSVHQALEEIATKNGDVDLLQKLARSPINTELSKSAQNLRIAAERDPYSAVENIRQVRDARAKMSETRTKTTVKKETAKIKKQVEAATPKQKKEDWASFAESLVC